MGQEKVNSGREREGAGKGMVGEGNWGRKREGAEEGRSRRR